MAGLFGTLGTANKGMNAQQKALETTSHNISNANTPGFSRQRVNLQADLPYTMTGIGQIGTGVKVSSITRIVDDFVVKNIRNETSALHQYEVKSDILGQLEGIFNEGDDVKGLSYDLSVYFDSWTKLANNPEFDNAKSILSENGSTLTDNINHMAIQIDDLKNNTLSTLEKSVLDVNGKLTELQDINSQIYKLQNDGVYPNDLLDRRDSLLKDIAGFSKVDASFDQYGRVSVKMDGQDILTPNSLSTISVVVGHDKDGNALVSHGGNSLVNRETVDQKGLKVGQLMISNDKQNAKDYQTLDVISGSSKGHQDALTELDQRLEELNQFAFGLASSVNMIHSDNGKSIDFFDLGSDKNYARNLKVSDEIKKDPKKINAAQNIDNHEVGDGSRALAISRLKDITFNYPITKADLDAAYDENKMTFKAVDGGLTFLGSFVDIVTKNGISKQQADNKMMAQDYIVNQLEVKNSSISGVNINEEVSGVIRYQRAFQANAKVISVISEMLDTLINRTGV